MTLRGIDVSAHQATTPPLAGLSFLFARASIGTARDTRYAEHIANARAAGLVTGAYHFGYNMAGITQAQRFLASAGKVGLYALDLEAYKVSAARRDKMTPSQARVFISTVHAAGHKIGLYHSDAGFPSLGQDFNWVANWSHEPARDWSFWQYRGSPLDLDRFAGTAADLARLAGIPTAPDTSTPEDAMKLTDVEPQPGHVTIQAAGPVWRVADDVRVDVDAGADWETAGTARYHHKPTDPSGSLGYLIRARAPDGELHIVAASRVLFTPSPVTRELAIAQARITKAITDLGGTP